MKLNQIDLFPAHQRGGKRDHAGRPLGEKSITVRVPLGCLNYVTEIIAAHKQGKTLVRIASLEYERPEKQPDLKSVTEFKSGGYFDKYINPKNPEEHWSGRGRKPMWIYEYLSANNKIPDALLNPNPTKPITGAKNCT